MSLWILLPLLRYRKNPDKMADVSMNFGSMGAVTYGNKMQSKLSGLPKEGPKADSASVTADRLAETTRAAMSSQSVANSSLDIAPKPNAKDNRDILKELIGKDTADMQDTDVDKLVDKILITPKSASITDAEYELFSKLMKRLSDMSEVQSALDYNCEPIDKKQPEIAEKYDAKLEQLNFSLSQEVADRTGISSLIESTVCQRLNKEMANMFGIFQGLMLGNFSKSSRTGVVAQASTDSACAAESSAACAAKSD